MSNSKTQWEMLRHFPFFLAWCWSGDVFGSVGGCELGYELGCELVIELRHAFGWLYTTFKLFRVWCSFAARLVVVFVRVS